MNTVNESTLKHNLCINCGLCKVTCPHNAITMKRNKYGEVNPVINKKKCTKCGLCAKFCPNTKNKIQEEALKISQSQNPQTFGLENATYYVGWQNNKAQRQKCCSGGVVTAIAKYLFESKQIDGMIHVERLWGKRGDLHYGARLSTSIKEIEENVSSAYQPIDFSEVLEKIKSGKTYFLTATPCVIRGIKKMLHEQNRYSNISILTCALVCSHNTNAQVIDFLTEINELYNDENWKVNIRSKDYSINDANNFKNHIYTKEKDLLNKNRHKSGWTDIWRSYYFAMNACLYCSDFWGYEADISVKDAWGVWAEDALGKSIIIIRNKSLENAFFNADVSYEQINYDTMQEHQKNTAIFKQVEAYNKNFKSIFSEDNKKNSLLKYKLISYISKFAYKYFGYKNTSKIITMLKYILVEWL